MFNKIKKLFSKEEIVEVTKPAKVAKVAKPPKVKEPVKELTEKEKATQAGEPYVNIVKLEVDSNDIHNGAFELDWNDKFIVNLIRAGYKQKDAETDNVIVDRWFQNVCRNIALELYEQQQADPTNRDLRPIQTRDLGNGRTEVS
jgi:hypothetical protein